MLCLMKTDIFFFLQIGIQMRGPLSPEDPKLIAKIRDKFLFPPSESPYNFRYTKDTRNLYLSGILIGDILKSFYRDKRGGFFVEAGALDGEYMSHTLTLEQEQGWTGLLVEPDEGNFAELKERHRKAWLTPSCLSIHGYPETAMIKRVTKPLYGMNSLNRGTGQIVKVTFIYLNFTGGSF